MRAPFCILYLSIVLGFSNAALDQTSFLLVQSHDAASLVRNQWASLSKTHRRFAGLSILEISLILVALVAVACIALLVKRFLIQNARIAQLTKRIQGLQHTHMANERTRAIDKEKKAGLSQTLRKVEKEEASFLEEAMLETGGILSKELQKSIDEIVEQGRVHVNIEKKLFTCSKPIAFQRQNVDEGKDPPKPQFENPAEAREVLADLASLLLYLKGTVILVEGHTEGGVDALGEVFFEVASQRAELVVDTLAGFGVPPSRMESRGRPGIIGDNVNDVKIVTLYWGL